MVSRFALSLLLLLPSAAIAQEDNAFPFLNQQAPVRDADPAEALARWLRVLGDDPNNIQALEGAGRAALECGDPSSSIGFWARANRLAPSDGTIKAGLAAALVQAEQPKLALKYFDQATALGVPEAEIAGDRGLAYDLQGNNRRAQQDYRAALKSRPDDELTQRLALSLAMSGDQPGALALLDPLLRRQDRAAWRTRAFVRALTGDVAGADQDARAVLPATQARQIAPFLARLGALTHEQQAAAVNFGEIPQAARPATTLDLAREAERPLPPAPRPAVLAAAAPPTAVTGATDFAGRSAVASAGPGLARIATTLAPARSSTATIPQQATGQPIASQALASATPAPTIATAAAPAPLASISSAPAASISTVPASGSVPTTLALAAAPRAAPASEVLGRTGLGGAAPASAARPGFDVLGADTPPPAAPSGPVLGPDVARTVAQAAATIAPPFVLPPSTPAERTVAAPSAAAPRPVPRPAPHAPARVQTLAAQTLGAQALAAGASLPDSGQRLALNLQPSGLLRSGRTPAGASSETTDAVDPAARVTTAEPRTTGRASAAGRRRQGDADDVADPSTAVKKPDLAAQRAAAAKSKQAAADAAKAKQAAADAAKEKAAARSAPSRVWVQVAGGAYKADLGKAWAKLKQAKPDLYAGKSPSTTPLRFTNRLLVGPFRDPDEAQAYVNRLTKSGQSGFVVKTTAGQKVEKVAE